MAFRANFLEAHSSTKCTGIDTESNTLAGHERGCAPTRAPRLHLKSHATHCRLSLGVAEPVWQADGRAVGCRVAGFKSLPDGTAGQAQRLGEARAGDVLTEINGVPVRDTSFDKVKREGVRECEGRPGYGPLQRRCKNSISIANIFVYLRVE